VGASLRRRREAHSAHARVAARVKQDEPGEGDHDQDLDDCEELEHAPRIAVVLRLGDFDNRVD
jgi:hypothetical protein